MYTLLFLLLCNSTIFVHASSLPVAITINSSLNRAPISPYIYGTNAALTQTEGWTAFRQGGNRLTAYNWENNASHAGDDYYHSNDNFLT